MEVRFMFLSFSIYSVLWIVRYFLASMSYWDSFERNKGYFAFLMLPVWFRSQD